MSKTSIYQKTECEDCRGSGYQEGINWRDDRCPECAGEGYRFIPLGARALAKFDREKIEKEADSCCYLHCTDFDTHNTIWNGGNSSLMTD